MAMKIYTDTGADAVNIAVHWDIAQTVDDGAGVQIPNPDYVEWYVFGGTAQKPPGQNNNAYVAQCKAEAKALAKLVRSARNKATRQATDLGVPEVDNS